jgi:predicted aldo/keto reductase-like oxidoreductase
MLAMRDYSLYRSTAGSLDDWLRSKYFGQLPEKELALCIECGWCEEQCPQRLNIVDEIRRARDALR